MRLHMVLSLTMALCMAVLFPGGLGLCNHHHCIIAGREDFPENLVRLPLVTESTTAEWSSSIGLRSRHGRVRVRTAVIPEGQKQPPVVAEGMAAEWSRSIGRRSPQSRVRVRMAVIPESKKQPPIVAESMAAEWSSSTGLRSPQSWVRVRAGVIPEGLKIMASHLPFPLGQQGQMTWLLCHPWITVWLLSMAGTALGLWRNVRRHKGQGRRQTASSFMATGYWKKRSLRYYRLLCRLKTANGVMLRCLRRVSDQRQKVIEYKHLKEKARVNDKKRSACPSSPCNSSQHVSPAD
ncbi:uncharacterized protein LOC115611879 [Strigops habroptila]|uniref:uncharacterized protein LOC115611879 n=1 Tax=Strigops habroptila TaxID=2489341 RepID=UPI0011CF9F70|nr:uncharacterized protein LOC115611879 [Strigops habroptila]